MIELLKKLTTANGVSGNEEKISSIIEQEIKQYVDEINKDSMGNLMCIKRGKGKKIMLASHMDEVGIIVTHIESSGYLRFSAVGGINAFYSLAQKVRFSNGTVGVIGYEEDIDEVKNIKLSHLYVDIGAKSKDDALKKVNVGDFAAFGGEFINSDGMISSKALDDRAGCAILIELAKKLKDVNHEIIYTFTTQEEVGLRGAKTAAYTVSPEWAFVVDVTGTGDTPKSKPSPIKCGGGPIIKIMDRASIINPILKELLIKTAEDKKIPFQLKVAAAGGTDAGSISLSREGIPTASLAIPCRYLHSPAEVIFEQDMIDMVNLLDNVIRVM